MMGYPLRFRFADNGEFMEGPPSSMGVVSET